MPHRAASPAMSENDFDITGALFNNNDSDSDSGNAPPQNKAKPAQDLDFLGIEDDDGDAAFIANQQASANRKGSNLKGRTVKKGGGFQAMGLNGGLLKAIARKGFSVPTPIQRKTIPVIMDDKDVVGMARTGSGKTAAFVIPMIEKLKSHSTKFGARGLIMSPSRELALQTLKVVKEMGRGTDLRAVLLVGGDSLEDQFGMMAGNPDIVIATPGRFLHLKVEMDLDLSSIKYVVFDEADRLFEMGFAAQLSEILHGLPSTRQTLLFSATLPKSLVEFARAGLQEPTLVRLDAESKISPDLQNIFFSVKSSDKEGALLHILHNVIQMPTGPTEVSQKLKDESFRKNNKRKRDVEKSGNNRESPTKHSTIVFAATKHHVDYLYSLLIEAGFATSYAYGALDQTARKIHVQNFRTGVSNILVVTDVAARGIDIPVLANVINYDFPSQPKIFVHRVGRTARAGQKGWSYSLVRDSDAPYMLDLQLFLGRRLVLGRQYGENVNFAEDVVIGSIPRDGLSRSCEWVNKLLDENTDVASQRQVSVRGEKLYMRTRNAASSESAKRAKQLTTTDDWSAIHILFNDEASRMENEREKMLARIGGYRPQETIFEVHNRRAGKSAAKGEGEEAMDTIKRLRNTVGRKKERAEAKKQAELAELGVGKSAEDGDEAEEGKDEDIPDEAGENMSEADESDLEVTFSAYSQPKNKNSDKSNGVSAAASFQNPDYFMGYTPTNHNSAEDRAYGVHSGTNSNFAQESRNAAMDLNGDEGQKAPSDRRSALRWDKRHKKYVARQNDEDGSKGERLVRGESGAKIAASFRSGRFQSWKKGKRMSNLPRVGEAETPGLNTGPSAGPHGRFRHHKQQAPKRADPMRSDYDRMKKKNEAARERMQNSAGGGSFRGKNEIRSTDDIRKNRNLKQKRREKNARPSRKK
ncbi:hypothetical protein PENSTE_c004G07919 [Penicillium steckii]|uniref:ATP-dependent RNA helicase DBP10 n=1 Tax=Penicillium steckii TaxID=303698 RepID=A0A1V6TLT5_9EURO|nr:hypothetical protein PENSTE_c004G07919 [Penicillium steckii]